MFRLFLQGVLAVAIIAAALRLEFNAVVVDIDDAGIPLVQFVSLISASGPQLDQPIRFGRCEFFQ